MKPRVTLIPALIGALALAASACAPAEEQAAEFTPGPLGAVTVRPDQPIKVGAIQVISGADASLGEDQQRALRVAMDDKGGKLFGHDLELEVEDAQCLAEGGTTAAQKLAADPQIVGVVGTSCSGAAVPAMGILADKGISMISGSNTSPSLTSNLRGKKGADNHKGYFRTAHNDVIQGQAAATFALERLKAKRAVTIHDGDPYTEGLANAFGAAFKEQGGKVALATAVDKSATDMRPILTEVAAKKPDLVFFPIFQPAADFIVRQAKEFPELRNAEKLMGADGLLSDTFVVIKATEGMYFSGPATPTGSPYQEFVGKYEEKFGEKPIQSFHAHAYDAFNMLHAAIRKTAVREDDGTIQIDRKKLMDALYATKNFEGLTGSLRCDKFGDCADAKIDIVQNTQEQEKISDVRGNVKFTHEP
ncbi:MAG: ABC transporter substrate-binding protein [Streptosporangiales bacterium]|nr:ABC transporter substrate-binding protein [Streptosporangiales bacterium]